MQVSMLLTSQWVVAFPVCAPNCMWILKFVKLYYFPFWQGLTYHIVRVWLIKRRICVHLSMLYWDTIQAHYGGLTDLLPRYRDETPSWFWVWAYFHILKYSRLKARPKGSIPCELPLKIYHTCSYVRWLTNKCNMWNSHLFSDSRDQLHYLFDLS
jgi:hypothetical protein